MRESEIIRRTAETSIELTLNLDGSGTHDIATGVGFLDHMLTLFAVHGRFDLTVKCAGDTQVDDHHSVEDVGICLGLALAEALGDKRGVLVRHFSKPRIDPFIRVTIGAREQMDAFLDAVRAIMEEKDV